MYSKYAYDLMKYFTIKGQYFLNSLRNINAIPQKSLKLNGMEDNYENLIIKTAIDTFWPQSHKGKSIPYENCMELII